MPTVREIEQRLYEIAPKELAFDWDNVGHLLGDPEQNVEKVLVALDITEAVADEALALGCQLIVAHHPVIFHPAKSITDETVNGQILLALTENKIAAICAHTNLDAVNQGVNDCLAQALKLTNVEQLAQDGEDENGLPYGIGRVGTAHQTGMAAKDYAVYVKECLDAASVRCADGGRTVSKVAVGGGSCGSMLREVQAAGCDTFVTADVKYDQYLEAKALGITLMDAGHFATEHVICQPLANRLAEHFEQIEVFVSKNHTEVYSGV